jgi:uncharacterized protein YbaR (Trm112 family)
MKSKKIELVCDCKTNEWKLIKKKDECIIICKNCSNRYHIKKELWKEVQVQTS